VPAATPAVTRPLDSVAILPFTGQWDKPDVANPDWPQKVRSLLEVLLPDTLSKGLVEQAPPGSLRIIATEVVRDRKLSSQSSLESGKALNVAAVLSGRVAADGKLSIQLIAVDSGELLWGKTYQLMFTLNPLSSMYVIGPGNEDYADIIKNVVMKLTGKEPVAAPIDRK